jgi:hypothetical protein
LAKRRWVCVGTRSRATTTSTTHASATLTAASLSTRTAVSSCCSERNAVIRWYGSSVSASGLTISRNQRPGTRAQLALANKSRLWLMWTTVFAPSPAADDGSVPLGRSAWSRKGHAVGIEVIALATAEEQKEHCASTLCLSLCHDGVCTQRIWRVAGQWRRSRQIKKRRQSSHRLLHKRSYGMSRPCRSLGWQVLSGRSTTACTFPRV